MNETSGYSETPLIKKLGYEPGEMIYLINPPDEFKSYVRDKGMRLVDELPATWIHGFFSSQDELLSFLRQDYINPGIDKGLWVSWPKKSSGVTTNLNEHTFRELILPMGWVDVKVTAIDETWSALKFLRRKNKT